MEVTAACCHDDLDSLRKQLFPGGGKSWAVREDSTWERTTQVWNVGVHKLASILRFVTWI